MTRSGNGCSTSLLRTVELTAAVDIKDIPRSWMIRAVANGGYPIVVKVAWRHLSARAIPQFARAAVRPYGCAKSFASAPSSQIRVAFLI
jgi:hypothetical protein